MNTNLNEIASTVINNKVPDRANRNIMLVSQHGTNHRDPGFLSQDFRNTFHPPPKLYVTAESDEFDTETLTQWKNAGFDVQYFAMGKGGKAYRRQLEGLFAQELEPSEIFGIIAYGDAAGFCLEHFHILEHNPDNKLGVLIAYYPDIIPDPRAPFPHTIEPLVHLAGGEVGVVKHSQLAGVEGKRRVVKKDLEKVPGQGQVGDVVYTCYKYDAEPGFAESDLDVYDRESAALAWNRSLAAVRRAFKL
ncbi:hypothetical protein VPNG_02129 [Cytospora leucostoma]|uniref:Dienelactone hydrolase domain-containing protein n=1 Tax=Cytospora leucostoma TaxID=1230097 RepID=A0A423XHG4_9PEZI|nr:hypothetical protein VPNG_02129 [Cytospora leucostoma]